MGNRLELQDALTRRESIDVRRWKSYDRLQSWLRWCEGPFAGAWVSIPSLESARAARLLTIGFGRYNEERKQVDTFVSLLAEGGRVAIPLVIGMVPDSDRVNFRFTITLTEGRVLYDETPRYQYVPDQLQVGKAVNVPYEITVEAARPGVYTVELRLDDADGARLGIPVFLKP